MSNQFKESSTNPLRSMQKGTPTDPAYFKKVSVKSIKEALMSAKQDPPQQTETLDGRHRKYKHRGSGDLSSSSHRVHSKYRLVRSGQSSLGYRCSANQATTVFGRASCHRSRHKGADVVPKEARQCSD